MNEKIIVDRHLGSLIGYTVNGFNAYDEIISLHPDIVLIDLLIPQKDGITLIGEIKPNYPEIQFIMVSQVCSKDMIGKAYEKGIEYYIQKPINVLEVESIIKKVSEKLEINNKLHQIRKLFNKDDSPNSKSNYTNNEQSIKTIMQKNRCSWIKWKRRYY